MPSYINNYVINSFPSPYQVGTANDPVLKQGSVEGQVKKFADEDKKAKAPQQLINPVDKAAEIVAGLFVPLTNARNLLSQAKSTAAIQKQTMSLSLEELISKIDNINRQILDLEESFNKLVM